MGESQYFKRLVEVNAPSQKDFFIDRDGFLFCYILLYLRTGKLDIEKKYWESVKTEAEFYELPNLVGMINAMIREDQPKETV